MFTQEEVSLEKAWYDNDEIIVEVQTPKLMKIMLQYHIQLKQQGVG